MLRPFKLAILAALFSPALHAQPTQRPFQVDDLFELEDIGRYYGGPYAWTQDGQKLAFTKVRAKKALGNHKWEYLWGNAGGDVWVQLKPGAEPVNITNGIKDGSGWWAPEWSPDGQKLALLSTRGGNVSVWIWTQSTGELKQIGKRGVDIVVTHERPYAWIDSSRLFYPALPGEEKPTGMAIELQTPTIATREWPKVIKGEQPTASVLESGVPVDLTQRPQGDLFVVDVNTGTERSIARVNTQSWRLAPNGKSIVYAREISTYLPRADQKLPFGAGGVSTLEIASIDGPPLKLNNDISRDVIPSSVRWSVDGNEIAFFGYTAGRDRPPVLYRVNVPQRTVTTRALPTLNVAPAVRESAQIEWTAGGDLIVFADKASDSSQPDPTSRRDWWLLQKSGALKLLSAQIKNPPRELWPQDGNRAFFGAANDELWRIEPATGKVENLTAKFEPKVRALLWPAATNSGNDQYRIPGRTYKQAIFSVQDGRNFKAHRVDLASGAIGSLNKPAESADLVAYEPATETAVFHASDRNGLRVWLNDVRRGQTSTLIEANGFLSGIAQSEFKLIEYKSLNGESLKGWILLPYGYKEGERYPLLTWVYAGAVMRDRPPGTQTINSSSSLNMNIPAAKGYAVLFPSMPLTPEGVADDPMLRLPEGVLPAVDKAIEVGIADPNRLYLAGQSFGGFSTYGLVTQTKKFHAAVSFAGLSNLIGLYGQFDARVRYTDYPQENLFQQGLMESAQVRMGNPPWKDLGRYIRNSPVFFVDRVETPLMIVQGDIDYVALQQGEEFFVSLYRQGKRASFVRYWGEGHVLESPANIRDMWQRIFKWLESFPEKPATTRN